MAAQAGKDLLVKLDDGTGNFITVAGLRTRQLTFNADAVDVTDQDSVGRWRELLSGAGARHATISGTGIFKDGASDALVQQVFFNATIRNFAFVVPGFGTVQGPFLITALVYKADHAQGVMFDLTVESAGAIAFTALPSH
jgi:TP901-1 family phage major tail protein